MNWQYWLIRIFNVLIVLAFLVIAANLPPC
jgi:hypothetical protein